MENSADVTRQFFRKIVPGAKNQEARKLFLRKF
jgi:hypothetical protein